MNLTINANEVSLAEAVDKYTNKNLRAMSREELNIFNQDMESIGAQYAAEPIRAALARNKFAALTVCRNVMYKAAQPYGGANAHGEEVAMRMILPVDVGYDGTPGNEEYWDVDLSGESVANEWGFQTGGTTPADDTMGEEEGNIIVGFTNPVPNPGLTSYQLVKGGKTFGYFPLQYQGCRADSIPFVETMAPIAEFPEESLRINMVVARTITTDRTQAIGLHFVKVSTIRTASA